MNHNWRRPLIIALTIASACVSFNTQAEDWPQWMGPRRDNTAPNEKLAQTWPADGPRRVWEIAVGQGFASPVVVGERVIVFHRLEDQDTLDALDATTGKRLWRFQYPSRFTRSMVGDRGPRSAPTIHRGRVYTYGAQGMAHCVDLKTGDLIWAVDTAKRFDTDAGFFGRLSSPLIYNETLLLNVGGENKHGIVALNLADGTTAWGATEDEASYSSPTLFEFGGKTHAAFFTRAGLVVLDPANGKVEAAGNFRSAQDASVNAATPLVHEGQIFLTTSYDVGALLVSFTGDDLVTVWANDQSLSSQYATPLLHDGYLYGIHGRVDYASDHLRCVQWATGEVMWNAQSIHNASVLLAGEQLLILTDTGELLLADPSPESLKPIARAQVLGRDGRASPALANGFLYARDQSELVCFDLRPAVKN